MNEIKEYTNKIFEDIKHIDENGNEYWYARELKSVLGYHQWRSINELIEREEESLINILNNYKNKKILIVGHSTALAALFSKWCKINYTGPYIFNNNEFFDGKWNYCETFKLEFDDNNNLISIINIR